MGYLPKDKNSAVSLEHIGYNTTALNDSAENLKKRV